MTTAGLVDIEWIIEDIAGDGVIDNPQASLVFGIDGRLSGSATCNRIFGRYQLQGKQLSIEPMGTTMMACPEAVDNQEENFKLPAVHHDIRYRCDWCTDPADRRRPDDRGAPLAGSSCGLPALRY
ncbi:MAG: META domain-containing protein [Gammaproteobacteria bacterium]